MSILIDKDPFKQVALVGVPFDAYSDLYDELDGNPFSHACPFARIMENKLAKHLVQVGIRTLNLHQREQVERFKVEVHEMKDWHGPQQLSLSGPLYISIDMDALDPAYAPGVSHHEPGGLSVRDINHMTAMVAYKLYKEVAAKMLT